MSEDFSPRMPLLLLGDHPEELTPKIHQELKKITGAAYEFRQVF